MDGKVVHISKNIPLKIFGMKMKQDAFSVSCLQHLLKKWSVKGEKANQRLTIAFFVNVAGG